jgi:D-arabinose 1-dehydrogenase-like Zn-dependent alcohol dehydrogenase
MSMRVIQVKEPNAPFELVERQMPEPGPREVRLKVEACGICHSDDFVVTGSFPGVRYPAVPGHEIAGRIDKAGAGVTTWRVGQRVGVGWFGGVCFVCDRCRRGDFITCRNLRIPGIHYDGGYADYMIAPIEALAAIPDDLSAAAAAPLLCAGITTFNALRNSAARPGDLVAIQGIGGLGHLAVQFAAKMGFRTVAIARGKEKANLAHDLGAHLYIDSETQDAVKELAAQGGAKVIVTTVTSGAAMTPLIDGLSIDGTLIVVGASPEPIEVNPFHVIGPRTGVRGWPSGTSVDSEDTMRFSAMSGVEAMIETYPLARAQEAYERMLSGKARFRVVLVP